MPETLHWPQLWKFNRINFKFATLTGGTEPVVLFESYFETSITIFITRTLFSTEAVSYIIENRFKKLTNTW